MLVWINFQVVTVISTGTTQDLQVRVPSSARNNYLVPLMFWIAEKKATDEPQLKKLYVDLSDCKVNSHKEGEFSPGVNPALVPQTWEPKRRRESTSSEDSREFDFERHAYSGSLQCKYKSMEINPCDPASRTRNNWLRYFVITSKWMLSLMNNFTQCFKICKTEKSH